ncbi:IS66 family transposase [Brucella thiophenivorans]|uniref:IS66 family transposase n=1 Tax=Brucella thiophenivorans TaxID=571255 RepID=UPI001F43F819|nr:transposase [Brucella thiophenivorans]
MPATPQHVRWVEIYAISFGASTRRSRHSGRRAPHRNQSALSGNGLTASSLSGRVVWSWTSLLARLLRRKEELLKVLERPEIPLHTNASENDLRSCVTKRKISGGTMSNDGRIARDTMLGLMKTCKKLRLSFWHYLGDRLGISNQQTAIPELAGLIIAKA